MAAAGLGTPLCWRIDGFGGGESLFLFLLKKKKKKV
jgi:hypothetical protein